MQRAMLSRGELTGGSERVDLCTPERFVGVDVSHAGERALIEERRLDRRTAAGETIAERARGEAAVQRLGAEPGGEVRLELVGPQEQPSAETSDVAVGDVRPVV